MTIPADVMMQLATIGLTADQAKAVASVLSAVEAATKAEAEAGIEKGRKKARARWHKWKSGQQTNDSKRLPTTANVSKQLAQAAARVEDITSNLEISGQTENKKDAAPKALSDLAAFKADLEQDATPEQVDAFAKHRKSKKGQNSAYAAKLFRRDAAECGLSVSQAIDTAISRGWLTVKPEYLAGRQQRSTSPPGRRNVVDAAMDRLSGQANGTESVFGNHGNVELLPARGGEPGSDATHLRGGIGRRIYAGSG